jgi:hypothetical protein
VTVTIDWLSFLAVFVVALIGALIVVGFYAIAVRLLVRGGKVPVVAPAEFTDAIAIISEKERAKAAKAAAKAAKKSPLTDGQQLVARIGAYISFGLCGLAVLGGLILIVIQ